MEKKLKEFDLKAALEGKPVQTRDGREVTQLHLFAAPKERNPLFAVVEGIIMVYRRDGSCGMAGEEDQYDLFMATEKVTKWMNVFKTSSGRYSPSTFFNSEKEAEECAHELVLVVATVPITFEV